MPANILFRVFPSTFQILKIKIYKNIISPVVSYRCATLSLTLGEEYRLRESYKRMLRRIYGPKREGWERKWLEAG
jgi:hypothetical protein